MAGTTKAIVFDAYGTLFDIHSVVLRKGSSVRGDLDALSQIWRRIQVELTWRISLMGFYRDFWWVTERALRSAMQQCAIPIDESQISALMDAYLAPAPFPEVPEALDALASCRLGVLSNGTPRMLKPAISNAGLRGKFAAVWSVDTLRTYKPSPEVYQLPIKAWGFAASEMLFVSSNAWDAAGAKAVGYKVCWCNRSGEPGDPLEFTPDLEVSTLRQIEQIAG